MFANRALESADGQRTIAGRLQIFSEATRVIVEISGGVEAVAAAVASASARLAGGAAFLGLLRRLRADARTQSVPVVMLTASNEERDVRESYALGANAHVRKPVELAAFAEAAKTPGLFWLSLNEPPSRTGEGL